MIYVFKTNVENKSEVAALAPCFNQLIAVGQWSFDLEDCDHILRVETSVEKVESIVGLLLREGFECEELEDYVPE
ncbi:hypothetical protein DSL64_06135 [Dyadobacter luteus]|jgi:hypothetical protein|uniref:Uncharacterized protein n=1 Tax=Dyadobacter luteus TaxID=2259619 RepID=A0A3D8YID5_9BACT|nr:hypothetical protein [Dyadobacter luteus]REA63191.1 hypothetical protein DSL64_06135 [Dyadobacter luteus]